ncbi:MAG: hypothetical protein J6N78_02160 [Clostridia bacterium]|nr:hypothetical protein [Clostridia bacterium]
MSLTKWERTFLNYYLEIYNAKWMRVFNNKHPLLDTRIDLFNVYKRKLKVQPAEGQETFTNMFKNLVEGKWYYVPDLLQQEKEE